MNLSEINITNIVSQFIQNNFTSLTSLHDANNILKNTCGIINFFNCTEELHFIIDSLNSATYSEIADNKTEYGDFQTNITLTRQITKKLKNNNINPEIIIEPTCGQGNFIIASLTDFDNIEKIFAIEIQKKYIWKTKFNILDFFLSNNKTPIPEINIIHSSYFNFDINSIKKNIETKKLLIIGNPPWVTNSTLSQINSNNLPHKTNFKKYKGFDAITGKSNFDIAEYITIDLLKHFGNINGHLAFLIKNSVIHNIVHNQPKIQLPIANLQKQNIDSKKEFDVSVDASLFLCELNSESQSVCTETDFYTSKKKADFGWNNNKFMSNISDLDYNIDGFCHFEWRQGIKHDCSKIMELTITDGHFHNKSNDVFDLENELVYPLLKSSDLKETIAFHSNRYTILTQKYVGQDTSYLKNYPLTYQYLYKNIDLFRNRKSKIYKNKYDFSIFGVGEYSFKPYKIAISGLYKTYHFCLVKPQDGKAVMLDDTCYFIGFDNLEQAEIIWKILNTKLVSDFLKSITFRDAKRMITKDILMRIDFQKIIASNDNETNDLLSTYKNFKSTNNNSQLDLFHCDSEL